MKVGRIEKTGKEVGTELDKASMELDRQKKPVNGSQIILQVIPDDSCVLTGWTSLESLKMTVCKLTSIEVMFRHHNIVLC